MVHVERISARIFCPFPDPTTAVTMNDSAHARGGNPVTIFKIQPSTTADAPVRTLLSPELLSQLASSCAWESVFVFPPDISADDTHDDSNENHSKLPQLNMAFYLPTGQPVSFCAHAAMGAAYAYFQNANAVFPKIQLNLLNNDGTDDATTKGATLAVTADHDPSTTYVATFRHEETDSGTDSNHQKSGTIALEVQNIVWQQEPIEHPTTLHRILREYHKVNGSTDCTLPMIEVMPTQEQWQEQNLDQYEPQILKSKYNKVIPLPTFLNSWVGDRKKTLVYINKDDTLHQRILPPPNRAAAVYYPAACDSLQHTTGLYLYATKTTSQDKMADAREIKLDYPALDPNAEENVWECRQFPRQSGYPEDPATGVAAAALAISLRFCEIETQRILGTDDTTTTTTTTDLLSTAPSSKYEFYQGTAMQQPSYIVVENIQVHSVVTQADEPNVPPVASDELSIFKYAQPTDNGNANQDNNSIPAPSVIADKMNRMADQDLLNDDERLAQEAARVDLFHNADDDELSEEEDDDDDDDDDDDTATDDAAVPLPPPPKDYRYQKHRGIVSFTLIGRIEVDAVETIEVKGLRSIK